MAQEKIEEGYGLKAWKGSLEEIAELFDLLHELVRADLQPEEVTQGLSAELQDREITFDSVAEFQEWGAKGKLRGARTLRGSAGSFAFEGLCAWITIERRLGDLGGISLHVSGRDPVAVSGIASQLRKAMDRGKRDRFPPRRLRTICLTIVALASSWTVVATFSLQSIFGSVVGALICLSAIVVNVFSDDIVYRLVPAVEVLESRDAPTIYERWRGKLVTIIGSLAIALVAAVVQAALT
ncbi:MAG TPA: hypothetical protein VIV13_06300 [Solirubrobacterales bacterium]